MNTTGTDLRAAFPPTPEESRTAFLRAVRSVKEDETMRKKYPVAILVAVILTLITTIAIAESWNVLQFLGIQPDSDAQTLVQPVSVSAKTGNVTFTIDSAMTDGEYLAFDYTITNTAPSKPVFLNVEQFSINGQDNWFLIKDSTLDDQWLPGFSHPASTQEGCIVPLVPEWQPTLTADTLHVDLVMAVHTAVNPVHFLEANHFEEALAKLDEGYTVIIGNDRFAQYSDSDILDSLGVSIPSGFSPGLSAYGTERATVTLSFDLDMKSAQNLIIKPEIPFPAYSEEVKLTIEDFTVTPLQVRLTAIATWAEDAPVGLTGKFVLRDQEGKAIKLKDVSPSAESYTETYWHDDRFTNKQNIWECAIIAPTSALPEEATLVYRLTNGAELALPLKFR